jgi:hypothetical protein
MGKTYTFLPQLAGLLATLLSVTSFSQVKTFEYTGGMQTFIVPSGVSTISVDMYGASGGWNDYSGVMYDKYVPGNGGRLQATYPVYPGQKIYIYVGGEGGNAGNGKGGDAGYNGGGAGNTSGTYSGGGGGGATDIRIDGTGLEHRVLVVGGGGGAAYNYPDGGDHGGQGGGLEGGDGQSNFLMQDESRGRGATQTSGGTGGQWPSYTKAEDGSLGKGGNGPEGTSGTGGGGGYYGGGGGCWSGGGGGSSYADRRASNIKHEQGVKDGHGKVIISVNCKMPAVSMSGPTTLNLGQEMTFTAQSNFNATLYWDKGVQNGKAFTPPLGKTIYTVSSSNPKECSYSIELTVLDHVNEQINPENVNENGNPCELKATTTNGIICEGETTTLIGHGGTNYSWSNGVQDNVAFVPPVGVNYYTVRTTGDENGCPPQEASVFIVVNKVGATADVQQNSATKNAYINITPTGGTYPYTYIWKKNGTEYSRTEDLSNLAPANYEVLIVDGIGCSQTLTYTITGQSIYNSISGTLNAELQADGQNLRITYNGYLDYKIINTSGDMVMTGVVNNEAKIDVSKLPAGNYRVCPLYNSEVQCGWFQKP